MSNRTECVRRDLNIDLNIDKLRIILSEIKFHQQACWPYITFKCYHGLFASISNFTYVIEE